MRRAPIQRIISMYATEQVTKQTESSSWFTSRTKWPYVHGDLYPKPNTALCDNDKLDFRGLLMKRCALILLLSMATVAQNSSTPSATPFDGKSWWNYVKVLADDNMEGRETGSAGLAGLRPTSSNSSRTTALNPLVATVTTNL